MEKKGIGYHHVDASVNAYGGGYNYSNDPFSGKRTYWQPNVRPHPQDGTLTPVPITLSEKKFPVVPDAQDCGIFCDDALEGKPSQQYAYVGPKRANKPGSDRAIIFPNEVPNVELAYLLINPERHYSSIADSTDPELENMADTLYNFLRAVQANEDGYFDDVYDVAFSINNGVLSGGSVEHFHINLHFLRRETDPDFVTKQVRQKERELGGRYNQYQYETGNGAHIVANLDHEGASIYTPTNATGDNQLTVALGPGKSALNEMTQGDLLTLLKGLRLSAQTIRNLHGGIPYHMHGRIPFDEKDAGTSPVRIKQDPLFGNVGNPVCDASIGNKISRAPWVTARELRNVLDSGVQNGTIAPIGTADPSTSLSR